MGEEGLSALQKFLAMAKGGAKSAGRYAVENPGKTTAGLGVAGLAHHEYAKHEDEQEHPLKHLLAKMGIGG